MNPQTSTQVADTSAFGGPNATQAANANALLASTPTYTASPSITSATLTPQSAINLPTQPPINTGADTNASIPSPVPTVESIVNQSTAPTATENQQSTLLQKIADLTGGQSSLATQQINAETSAGVPALNATLKSLTAQLQGYNDQSTKLQLDASVGGTIQNQTQSAAEGRGITAAGLAPITSAQLRNNQIQQATIAGQALTTKAALYAAQNDYTNAKDAADKAAQVTFDAQTQEISHQQALLAAIQPQLNKEQATRAASLQAQLNERQSKINNQREDFKTGQGLAITAMQLNPNDPTAQFAAQQALKLDPTDPQYLQKVNNLVGKYQQNPLATQKAILDLQSTRADIAYKNAQTAKLTAEAKDTGLDPSQLIAYAQEYASTGKIPTGLPKGAFGAVSEYAKGAPKADGTIVNSSTGVTPSNISSAQIDGLSALRDLTKKLGELQTMYNNTGLLSQTSKRQQFTDLKGEIVDLLSRARSGAALTESEVATYTNKLPSLVSTGLPGSGASFSFGDAFTGDQKIVDLQKSLSGKLDTSLAAHGATMVGYSKVNVGGQLYTVGQVVTNAQGQQGIINADGTITTI